MTQGRQSLLHTLSSVMTSLQRKPRQLIVTSLEEDLLATAQNFVPVSQANGEWGQHDDDVTSDICCQG